MGFFNKLFGGKSEPAKEVVKDNALYAHMVGKCVPLSEVPDPTFSEELLGKGIAVQPTVGKVYAPCDCTVAMTFDTKHAVSLETNFGAEILIHVGLETVNLNGEHFTLHVAQGDKVKKGQLLLEMDLDAIKAKGYKTITPMVVCNSVDFPNFTTDVNKDVTNSDIVIELSK